ncbi:MAG: TadE/TadG family type IV pilus assembly protein [bacterium]
MRKPELADEKGVAVVEFALVLPLLLALFFGMVEFGVILYDQHLITNATREGARAGIVAQDPRVNDDAIKKIVKDNMSYLISLGKGAVASQDPNVIHPTNPNFGDDLTVNVSYQYHFLVASALIPGLGDSIELRAQTVMKYE